MIEEAERPHVLAVPARGVAELQVELDLLQDRSRGAVTFDQLGITLGRLLQVLARNGFRVIAHDRRGHGRSTQASEGNEMDTYAADVDALVTELGLTNAIHIGHSTGGGEVTRDVQAI